MIAKEQVLSRTPYGSGFIFTEVEAENRSYATWKEQIEPWGSQGQWRCHSLVSDGAKALVKLAVSG